MPSATIELVINLREDELNLYDSVQPEPLVSGAYWYYL